MDRIIDTGLKTTLLLAVIGTLLSMVRMLVAIFLPISYYWWGAVAFMGGTVVLAAAIHLRTGAAPAYRKLEPGL